MAHIRQLSSPDFFGRGYVNSGMEKAGNYLALEFKKMKLLSFDKKKKDNYFQEFTYPVNTFPSKMELSINGKKLEPGKDFIVDPSSSSLNTKGKLKKADSVTYIDYENRFILAKEKKLTWGVSGKVEDYTIVLLQADSVDDKIEDYTVDIKNEFIKNFKAKNIVGFIPGNQIKDSFIVITAHYDHLGGMGDKAYFPGANDNASGVSLLLSLAKHYSKVKPKYSIAFMLFAGEEIGLLGSNYYTKNPLFPLKKIKFLLNTDLAGTGDDGITVVNGSVHQPQFDRMVAINNSKKYLKAINIRGKAANSDHYHFSENGVPAFFFYTMGGTTAYHDVFDIADTLPLTEFEDLHKLLVEFIDGF